jgi:hypothetical protein
MNTYDVYFRNDLQRAKREFLAPTPENALELAQAFARREPACLHFEYLEIPPDALVREIEVCDEDGASLVLWYDADTRLRLAAPGLLSAAENVLDRWQDGGIGEVVHQLTVAVDAAKEGAA